MRNLAGSIGIENAGYILPGDQHDSDPRKDWNPLYLLAGRDEVEDVLSVTLDRSAACPTVTH